MSCLTIAEAISILRTYDPSTVVINGWGENSAHSYRGFYDELALSSQKNTTVKEMIEELENSIGPTFCGWKGGEYTYWDETPIHFAEMGCTGEDISEEFLKNLIEKTV